MKQISCFLILSILLAFSTQAKAIKSTDLDLFEYEVRFTNPDCPIYEYDRPVRSQSGDLLFKKPRTYCNQKDMRRASRAAHSPIRKVLQWVNSSETKDITVLTFSLSNSSFINALCKAQKRDVDVQIVMDDGTDPEKTRQTISRIKKCKNSQGHSIEVLIRGGEGGLGIHHNKLLAINAKTDNAPLQIAYGSANFSSGLVLHHENWSFVTVQKNSYFAQNHLCMLEGVIAHGRSKTRFKEYINDCKDEITFEKESDITLYIAPIEGDQSMEQITRAMLRAKQVDLAAHRFSNRSLIDGLYSFIEKNGASKLRMFFDDDMFWAAKDGRGFGNQDRNESRLVRGFLKAGVEPHYAQTEDRQHLLHHNKFVLLRDSKGQPTALHTGAGNLTNAAFNKNFENFYFITRPDVLEKYARQYSYLFEEVGTHGRDMPVDREPSFK